MTSIELFTTAGCHLCEQAMEILVSIQNDHAINIISTEIGDDDTLVEQYGIKIPVLKFPSGQELDWPFTEQAVLQHIDS
jgi:hypothetical protein